MLLHDGVGRLLRRRRRVNKLALGRGHRVAVAVAFWCVTTSKEKGIRAKQMGGFGSSGGGTGDRGVQASLLQGWRVDHPLCKSMLGGNW